MVCEKRGDITRKKLETGEITQWKKITNSENKRQEKKECSLHFDNNLSCEDRVARLLLLPFLQRG